MRVKAVLPGPMPALPSATRRRFRRRSLALAIATALASTTAAASPVTISYTYDALGRVTGATYSDGTGVMYAYDAAGNRTQSSVCNGQVFLGPNQALWSPSHTYQALMQSTDGNLVVKSSGGTVIWSSGTAGNPGASAVMQPSGKLAIVNSQGAVIWTTNNFEGPCSALLMQDDSNLVIYQTGGVARWASNNASAAAGAILPDGAALIAGQELVSTDGRFHMQFQNDGNLHIIGPGGTQLWSTSFSNPNPTTATMQPGDGNFVVSGTSGPLWSAGTGGHVGDYLIMQTDGNLVIYAPASQGGGALWASGTAGH